MKSVSGPTTGPSIAWKSWKSSWVDHSTRMRLSRSDRLQITADSAVTSPLATPNSMRGRELEIWEGAPANWPRTTAGAASIAPLARRMRVVNSRRESFMWIGGNGGRVCDQPRPGGNAMPVSTKGQVIYLIGFTQRDRSFNGHPRNPTRSTPSTKQGTLWDCRFLVSRAGKEPRRLAVGGPHCPSIPDSSV